jgi:hypothetical protein
LTNLPIFHGERVYVFVLHETEDGYSRDRACYSNYLYKPLLLPFESDYDDYGGGENSGGYAFPVVMDALRAVLVEKEVGEDDFREMAINGESLNEEVFFRAVWADRLEVKTYFGTRKIKFVMMRKDVVDSILDRWVIEEFVDYDYNANKGIYRKYTFQDVLNDVGPFLAKIEETYEKMVEETSDDTPMVRKFPLHLTEIESWLELEDRNLVSKKLRFLRSDGYNAILNLGFQLPDAFIHGKFLETRPFIETLLKGMFINEFMESTRRCWVPPCGEGSQDNDHDPYELLSNVILERIESHKKEMDEW